MKLKGNITCQQKPMDSKFQIGHNKGEEDNTYLTVKWRFKLEINHKMKMAGIWSGALLKVPVIIQKIEEAALRNCGLQCKTANSNLAQVKFTIIQDSQSSQL